MLSHDCKIRVWYKHTDQMAICHHSNYICYYEAARSELLRELGTYSVACFAAALGRGGVKLALCGFGVRCAFILPCTFFLAAWGMRAAYARLRGPKKRRAPLTGADRTRLALCALLLAAGVFAELTAVPKLLQLGLAAIT